MSLSAVKFFDKINYTNRYGEIYSSYCRFKRSNIITVSVPANYVEFYFITTGSDQTRTDTLFTYANGDSVKVTYKFYLADTTHYYLQTRLWLANKNGQEIITGASYSNTYSFIEGTGRIPFANCFYMASKIEWNVNNNAVVGDPAQYASPIGTIIYERFDTTAPVGGWKAMRMGEWENEEFFKNFAELPGYLILGSDQEFNNYNNTADQGGDGTPYREIGDEPSIPDPSGPGGGDTPSTDAGDPVDFPGLPTVSAISTGLVTLYNPSPTQLRSLAGVLWGNDFEQSIKKILNDPFDGVIGLSMIPFTPGTTGSLNCQIGNFDTEVSMPVINAQYYTIDFGSLNIPESWHSALDYSPTTLCDIWLPFVGFRSLKVEDIMGNTVALKYNVDILSGAGVAIIKCGDKALYEYPCKVNYDIPLTGSNKAALYTGLINVAMSGLTGAAIGGAMGAVGGAATSAIQTATSKQSSIEKSGAITSNTGVLGEFTPYIVLRRPVQSMPKNYRNIKGYQSNITAALGSLRGYTEVDFIHLTGIEGATDTELQEIETLLKNGVII